MRLILSGLVTSDLSNDTHISCWRSENNWSDLKNNIEIQKQESDDSLARQNSGIWTTVWQHWLTPNRVINYWGLQTGFTWPHHSLDSALVHKAYKLFGPHEGLLTHRCIKTANIYQDSRLSEMTQDEYLQILDSQIIFN